MRSSTTALVAKRERFVGDGTNRDSPPAGRFPALSSRRSARLLGLDPQSAGSNEDGKRAKAAQDGARDSLDGSSRHDLSSSAEQRLERDPSFHPGDGCDDVEMDACAESQVVLLVHVEPNIIRIHAVACV